MQTLKSIFFILFLSVSFTVVSSAQTSNKKIQVEEFEVKGVCNMCKKRIEDAAMVKGVVSATWDKDTGIMKVVYRKKKVDSEDIHQAIAEAGHDTSKVEADQETYDQLPACCQYDSVHKH